MLEFAEPRLPLRSLMQRSLGYLHRLPGVADQFRTAVSLHGHTLHSKEGMLPLCKFLLSCGELPARLVTRLHEQYGSRELEDDLAKMWWTPPLGAQSALSLEQGQIEELLGLDPVVSITDHDSIDAPLQLQVLDSNPTVPVSVEWTVPFRDTYFHLGVHNLRPSQAPATMERLAAFTDSPSPRLLPLLVGELACQPSLLLVLNHPFWDQPLIGEGSHEARLEEFLLLLRPWIHALEINGLRSRSENRLTVLLSRRNGIPLVSGGDRHGREPNATLNLTNARTFGAFATEVRSGKSHVVLMPQYRRPLWLRIAESVADIVADAPDHVEGWTSWTQRVFRECDDGVIRAVAEMADEETQPILQALEAVLGRLGSLRMPRALEWAVPQTGELV